MLNIQDTLKELYGVAVSTEPVECGPDKIWSLVEVLQNLPLISLYVIVYSDTIHLKLHREGKVKTVV